MRVKNLLSWLLIFALVMPTILLVSTSTVYAFSEITGNNGIYNFFKALLAVFFLARLSKNEGENVESQSQQEIVDDEGEILLGEDAQIEDKTDIIETENIEESKDLPDIEIVLDEPKEKVISKDWTKERVYHLSTDEREMLALVNKERIRNGLNSLKIDFRLVKVARAKSQNMIDKDYFSHDSPNYGSPFDMMERLNIDYLIAGENIAGAPKVILAHDELMKSLSHKKNILHQDYTHIGIGIVDGGRFGKMFSQEFARIKD